MRRSLKDFERIIGRDLGFDPNTTSDLIDRNIDRQIQEHNLQVCRCDLNGVDWRSLIANSVSRKPPFDASAESEKGFRDAVILETFLQLVADTPDDRTRYRVLLLTRDGLLTKAASTRLAGTPHAEVVTSVDAIRSRQHADVNR